MHRVTLNSYIVPLFIFNTCIVSVKYLISWNINDTRSLIANSRMIININRRPILIVNFQSLIELPLQSQWIATNLHSSFQFSFFSSLLFFFFFLFYTTHTTIVHANRYFFFLFSLKERVLRPMPKLICLSIHRQTCVR